MVAADDQRLVQIGGGDEVGQRVVVQARGAGNVPFGEAVRIADVDDDAAFAAQFLRLFGADAFEIAHLALASQSQ